MLPEEERPYEKCRAHGPEALTDAELLSVLLRTGTKDENALALASRVLHHNEQYSGLLGLCHESEQSLLSMKGIGRVKAMQILCVVELSKRIARSRLEKGITFTSAKDVAAYYMEEMRHLDREELRLLMLDQRGRLIKEMTISVGTVNMTCSSPREIFRESLLAGAVQIMLLHNHPSGDVTPSRKDIEMTEQIISASHLVGIPLVDHLIIGDGTYASIPEHMSGRMRML